MKNPKSVRRYALSVIAVLLYLFALLCAILPAMCRSEAFYARGFSRYSDEKLTGLTDADEQRVAAALAKYFSSDGREEAQIEVTRHGESSPAFTDKELSHLADILRLLQFADQGASLSFAALLLALVCVCTQGERAPFTALTRAYCALPVLLVLFAVWAAINFDGLFITFHKLLFTNNDWLLNPREHLLVQLMPTGFFFFACKRLALWLLPALLAPYIALRLVARGMKKGGEAQ